MRLESFYLYDFFEVSCGNLKSFCGVLNVLMRIFVNLMKSERIKTYEVKVFQV